MYIHTPTVRALLGSAMIPPRLTWRRAATVVPFSLLVHAGLTGMLAGLRALDHVGWGGFAQQPVVAPAFVVSNPRSGTTMLHRLLALDEERFTWLKLWQTCMPAVSFYRAVGALVRLDNAVGQPGRAVVRRLEKAFFGGWDGVHNMGFSAAEEEEAYFVHTWMTPAMGMFYPFLPEIEKLGLLDEAPLDVQRAVMGFHRTSIQRHLFAGGTGKTFLSKNVMMSGRLHALRDTYPDARIIQIVRHPYDALPSFCSMFTSPWGVHSPEIEQNSEQSRYWARLGTRFYLHTHRTLAQMPADQRATVRYDDLVADPVGTVLDIYRQLNWEASPAFIERLRQETSGSKRYERKHSYTLEQFGLTRDGIYEDLREIFDAYGFERTPELADAAQ